MHSVYCFCNRNIPAAIVEYLGWFSRLRIPDWHVSCAVRCQMYERLTFSDVCHHQLNMLWDEMTERRILGRRTAVHISVPSELPLVSWQAINIPETCIDSWNTATSYSHTPTFTDTSYSLVRLSTHDGLNNTKNTYGWIRIHIAQSQWISSTNFLLTCTAVYLRVCSLDHSSWRAGRQL